MDTPPSERPYWMGLNMVRGIGPAKFRALKNTFGSARAAWEASESALDQAGLDRRTLEHLGDARQKFDLPAEMARLEAADIRLLTWDDEDYPAYLKEIYDPPPVLFVRGELLLQDQWSVAVVGTRRASAYGRLATERLAGDMARSGVTIVSGLARGIDSIAHQAALDAGGRTIAVLGSGVSHIYPAEHRPLAARIVASGALVSEFHPDARPEAGNFPRRNRIISGLSMGVLVVEAGERSGASITANYALDQGREVLAVPGPINSRTSVGTNRLIQRGAKLVMTAEDVLGELNMTMVVEQVAAQLALPATDEEAHLLRYLSDHPLHVDELCREAGMAVSQVTSTLTLMELKGMVRQLEGMSYIRLREPDAEYGDKG